MFVGVVEGGRRSGLVDAGWEGLVAVPPGDDVEVGDAGFEG